MRKFVKRLVFGVAFIALGACERVKDKETVAQLSEISEGDTLVLAQDSLGTDTSLPETVGTTGADADTSAGNETYNGNAAGTASASAANASGTGDVHTPEKNMSPNSVAAATPVTQKRTYRRPTQRELNQVLAKDARLSERMGLSRLKRYWLYRQQYYRKATKEVKYVSGETKINITPEETKIETPRGKVKIEGNDIKVKPD